MTTNEVTKELVALLSALASQLPQDDTEQRLEVMFVVGGCKYTFRPTANRQGVNAAIRRVKRAVTGAHARTDSAEYFRRTRPVSTGRAPYSDGVYAAFLRDGDVENAASYAALYGRTPVFVRGGKEAPLTALVGVSSAGLPDGFVVGRFYRHGKLTSWNVTHVETGMSCSCASTARAGAVLAFNSLPPEKLAQALDRQGDGAHQWQAQTRAEVMSGG